MSNKTDPNNQEFMTTLMQYMSKPYIKNQEAFQLAWKSSVFCSSDFGKIFNNEEIAKGRLFKIQRDRAVQDLAECKVQQEKFVKELQKFHIEKDDNNPEASIIIKKSDVENIELETVKLLFNR